MIWLTWRQFRTQGIVAAGALAALAITLAVTGPHLAALSNSSGLNTCGTQCGAQAANFIAAVKGGATEIIFYGGAFLLYAVPVLIGIFWGAPLVTREVEAGTHRLAWNQSVTRARWVAAKLGLIGLAAMATAGLLSLMTSWWASPLYGRAAGRAQRAQHQQARSPALRRHRHSADRLRRVRVCSRSLLSAYLSAGHCPPWPSRSPSSPRSRSSGPATSART